ncbi:MAG: SIS domain-containing protein [Anaerolineaceae bacterium]|nr:SIS domain-containing protein [Anaerolineaceae bacterium]
MKSSILQSEILEQPLVVQELLNLEKENVANIAKELNGKFKYILIAARGTSDNAARYAQYLFGAHNHLQVALATPSLFSLYNSTPDLSGALVLAVSQSGQSPDIVSVITEGRRQGRPTLAITNDVGSPLALASEYVIPLHAGPEKAIAATKTYTTSLAALALFSCSMDNQPDRLNDLLKISGYMQQTFSGLEPVLGRIERFRYMEHCAVLGRGYNYSTAFEIALKIKELSQIVAEPYSSADFRHGPIATVLDGFPVIVVMPQGVIYQDMVDLVNNLKERKAEMLIISDNLEIIKEANLPLPIPAGIQEWLTPLVAVIPGQYIGMRLAIEKGLNPDQPIGLHKVTETI